MLRLPRGEPRKSTRAESKLSLAAVQLIPDNQ
jgi:hypothetical protein